MTKFYDTTSVLQKFVCVDLIFVCDFRDIISELVLLNLMSVLNL